MPATKKGHGFGLLFEMGCGKTLTAIAVAGAAYEMGKIDRALIIAPTSVVAVWPKELKEFADFRYTASVLLGDKKHRLKELESLKKYPFKGLKVAVINYESTWREGIFEALQDYDADLIICDESQRIKTHDAEQSKAIHKLGDQARYKLILSGTPVQNNAMDIFSQYRFLDSSVFGLNFYRFRSRYAIMGGFNRKQVVAYKDLDDLIKKEHSIAFRVTKEEAIDLPEQTFITHSIEMTRKERDLYDRIRIDSYADDSGGKPTLVSKSKLDALADIIQDYVVDGDKKLVIFARFLAEVHEIIRMAEKILPAGKKAVAIYGEIKKEDRGEVVRRFQEDPDTVIFIGQIDTAGTGITLTAASTCVYYSKTYNYATYEQSLSRIHRIGQKNHCTYIDLVIEKTVDEMITKALAKKEDIAKTVVDSWREFF